MATFLAVPSRAILAVALTLLSPSSKAILSSTHNFDVLDFSCVKEQLGRSLKDEDLHAMLICIDALYKLKRLKLENCNMIAGSGLRPLRGSLVINVLNSGKYC